MQTVGSWASDVEASRGMTPDEQRATGSGPDWLEPLIDRVIAAEGPEALAAVFEDLRAELGSAEAGRRWWAAFGASDASAT